MVAIALFMIIAVIFIKYQFVCEVTVDGEKLGYVTDKEQFEQSVNEIINREEENKLFTTIAKMPEYHFKFVDKTESTNSEEILAKIESSAETTYKIYAVTIDGKEKVKVANLEEAESLVKELNKKYEKEIKVKIGIVDVITTDKQSGVKTIKTAKTNLTKTLDSKVKVAEAAAAASSSYTSSSSSTTVKVASLNGVKLTVTPLSGIITSRFGNMESIRSSGHSGLDIAAPKGTAIKVAASGTVIFAGYSGGYGNTGYNNYCCPSYGNYGYGYGGYGYGAAIILVLFILLVVVFGAGFLNYNN